MQDGKFWRIAAVLMIAAVFYVGHGLHQGGGDRVPSLVNVAHAGGVAVTSADSHSPSATKIYTSDESGTRLYVWNESSTAGAKPKFVASAVVPREVWDLQGGPERK